MDFCGLTGVVAEPGAGRIPIANIAARTPARQSDEIHLHTALVTRFNTLGQAGIERGPDLMGPYLFS